MLPSSRCAVFSFFGIENFLSFMCERAQPSDKLVRPNALVSSNEAKNVTGMKAPSTVIANKVKD